MQLKKTFKALTIGLASSLVFVFTANAGDACCASHGGGEKAKSSSASVKAIDLKTQTTCPVMNKPIDKALYVDHNGQRIYVCCKGCIAEIQKNPEKYIKKLKKMGQVPEAIAIPPKDASQSKALTPQKVCPVMGGEINKSQYVDYQGKRIYVCCAGCIDPIKADPEKYIKQLASMGQDVETIK